MKELYKFIVQAVVIERDESGKIIGESVSQVVNCFTPEDMIGFYARAKTEIEEVAALSDNNGNNHNR